MPSEIRNSIFPTTAADLLLPPAGGAARGGEAVGGFDSLLRALTPPQRIDLGHHNPADAPRSQPPREEASGSRSESTSHTSSSRQADERSASASQRRSDDSPNGQANSSSPAQGANQADRAAENGSAPPHQPTGEAKPSDEASEVPNAEATPDDSLDEVADPNAGLNAAAQQLAALAAQQQQPTAVEQPVVTGEEEVAEAPVEGILEDGAAGEGAASAEQTTLPGPALPVAEAVEVPNTAAATEANAEPLPATTPATAEAQTPTAAAEVVEPTAGAEQVENTEEEPRLSDLRSTRTAHTQAAADAQHASAKPSQVKGSDEKSSEATDESETDSLLAEEAEATAALETTAIAEVERASGDSRLADQRSEPQAEIKPAESTATPAIELATPAEPPPADSAPRTPQESPRADQSPVNQPTTQVDPNQRPAGMPRLAAELLSAQPREVQHARPVEIDSARFLHRVARAFAVAEARGGEVQLRLSPPELGSLRVEIKVLDGVMTARVETESAAAKTAVLEHLPQLRERLSEQGVRIERFDVDLMQHGSTGTPDGSSDRSAEQQPVAMRGQRTSAGPKSAEEAVRPTGTSWSSSDGLNVIV